MINNKKFNEITNSAKFTSVVEMKIWTTIVNWCDYMSRKKGVAEYDAFKTEIAVQVGVEPKKVKWYIDRVIALGLIKEKEGMRKSKGYTSHIYTVTDGVLYSRKNDTPSVGYDNENDTPSVGYDSYIYNDIEVNNREEYKTEEKRNKKKEGDGNGTDNVSFSTSKDGSTTQAIGYQIDPNFPKELLQVMATNYFTSNQARTDLNSPSNV